MKRFLLPLLAALALPTAVNAETVWLVLRYQGMTSIPTDSMEQCEASGQKYMSKKKLSKTRMLYWCLEGSDYLGK